VKAEDNDVKNCLSQLDGFNFAVLAEFVCCTLPFCFVFLKGI